MEQKIKFFFTKPKLYLKCVEKKSTELYEKPEIQTLFYCSELLDFQSSNNVTYMKLVQKIKLSELFTSVKPLNRIFCKFRKYNTHFDTKQFILKLVS